MTDSSWEIFVSWFTARKRPLPVWSNDGVFVAENVPNGRLIAGCLIYPTDGPYAVVEFAATNPTVSLRQGHDAMVFGAQALMVYGAMRRKIMLCFPVSKGMTKMLQRAGFQANHLPYMYPAMVAS